MTRRLYLDVNAGITLREISDEMDDAANKVRNSKVKPPELVWKVDIDAYEYIKSRCNGYDVTKMHDVPVIVGKESNGFLTLLELYDPCSECQALYFTKRIGGDPVKKEN